MNIFYLDKDPAVAARLLHDRHIIKMISECCQLLSGWASQYKGPLANEVPAFDSEDTELCADTPPGLPWTGLSHLHHPCTLWLLEGLGNVDWLVKHLAAMIVEYDYHYPGRQDKFERARVIAGAMPYWLGKFAMINHTTPKACYPDEYKREPLDRENVMQGYRAYYMAEKVSGQNWTNREPPEWVVKYKEETIKKIIPVPSGVIDFDIPDIKSIPQISYAVKGRKAISGADIEI